MNLFKYLTNKNIAVFFIVLMCVQYIPVEGYTVSFIKVGTMCIAPVIWLLTSPKISKAFVWGVLYCIIVLLAGLFHPESFRISTICYLLLFIFMFIMYYNLIHIENAFTLDFFIFMLKSLILAYAICLIVQQLFIIAGVRYFPLINLVQYLGRGIGANSLVQEPSVTARMLAVAFLSLLRMYEVKYGKESVNPRLIWENSKWVVLGFLWAMLTMGSGTAFIALGMLSLYFVKRQYILWIVPLITLLYFVAPYIDFQPLQRARVVFDAAITLDQSSVIKADGSAAHRVVPIINTLTELDLTDSQTWFGRGVDNGGVKINTLSTQSTIGGISSFGLLSYIIALILIFRCIIYRVFSLETLICFVLVGLTINNFAYIWGIYMILATTRYFIEEKQNQLNDE